MHVAPIGYCVIIIIINMLPESDPLSCYQYHHLNNVQKPIINPYPQ